MVRQRLRQALGYLGSGLIALFPAAVTIWVISAVVRWLADVFGPHSVIGKLLQPKDVSGPAHGLIMAGVYIVALLLIVLLGYSTQRRASTWVMQLVNLFFSRFPIVNRVYSALQQVANVMRSQAGDEAQAIAKFGDVCYARYANLWVIAMLTSRRVYRVGGEPHVQIFLSTSPMPATGFLYLVPIDDVLLTNLDIEAYTKVVVSFGSLTSQTLPRDTKQWRLRVAGGAVEADTGEAGAEEAHPAETEAEAPRPKRTRRRKTTEPEPPADEPAGDATDGAESPE